MCAHVSCLPARVCTAQANNDWLVKTHPDVQQNFAYSEASRMMNENLEYPERSIGDEELALRILYAYLSLCSSFSASRIQ